MEENGEARRARFSREARAGRLSPRSVREFREIVYRFSRGGRRNLPWRATRDPYRILVSEVMLQQTQVERVREKFAEFIKTFPDFESLARASLRSVLAAWSGLGYNRRARSLRAIARRVVSEHRGGLPSAPEILETFPGIGKATARSIAAFAFNIPTVFVETNIRTVFIHYFFPGEEKVSDGDILPLVEATLDGRRARRWYSALMDCGAWLKKSGENHGRRSVLYRRQPPFKGSRREARGRIVKLLLKFPSLSRSEIARRAGTRVEHLEEILVELKGEGLISEKKGRFSIE